MYKIRTKRDCEQLFMDIPEIFGQNTLKNRMAEILETISGQYGTAGREEGGILFFPTDESYSKEIGEVSVSCHIDMDMWEYKDSIPCEKNGEVEWLEELYLLSSGDLPVVIIHPVKVGRKAFDKKIGKGECMMNTFLQQMVEMLKGRIEAGWVVCAEKIEKGDDVLCDALLFFKEGSQQVLPVWMESYYQSYLGGISMEQIVESIMVLYKKAVMLSDVDLCHWKDNLNDYEKAGEHLFIKLVNLEMSRAYLEDKVYVPMMDLAAVFCYEIVNKNSLFGITALPFEIFQQWKVTKKQMLEETLDRMKQKYPVRVFTLNSSTERLEAKDSFGKYMNQPESEQIPEMCVVSNQSGINGAGVILYKGILKSLTEMFQVNGVFVLPVSIHEVIVLPYEEGVNTKSLKEMLAKINMDNSVENEFLSDNVYLYKGDTDSLDIMK